MKIHVQFMKFFLRYATKAAKPSECCAAGIRYHPSPLLPGGGDYAGCSKEETTLARTPLLRRGGGG